MGFALKDSRVFLEEKKEPANLELETARVRGLMPNARILEFPVAHFWQMVFLAAVIISLLVFFVMKFIPEFNF